MELRKLTPTELITLHQTELRETFPTAELRPYFAMRKLLAQGVYHPYVWEEAGDLLGYALLWSQEEGGYLLLDYLGIPAQRRGNGCGRQFLVHLQETFRHWKGIFGEVEAPNGDAGDPLRVRRLDFYQRCGFQRVPYDRFLFGVHYRTLLWGEDPIEAVPTLMETHRGLYRSATPGFLYRRMIQIPYQEPTERRNRT